MPLLPFTHLEANGGASSAVPSWGDSDTTTAQPGARENYLLVRTMRVYICKHTCVPCGSGTITWRYQLYIGITHVHSNFDYGLFINKIDAGPSSPPYCHTAVPGTGGWGHRQSTGPGGEVHGPGPAGAQAWPGGQPGQRCVHKVQGLARPVLWTPWPCSWTREAVAAMTRIVR